MVLGVWGYRAVVRLPDPKLKTLGERGIECIFVRYAEHSKAFKFYVIEPNESVLINSIIKSKDAMFDENRFSSVPRPSLRISDGTEDISGLVVLKEMDVKTAFLNGDLDEEVYMNQPQDFIMPGNENKDMGEADVTLGIMIIHESNEIEISQSHYIKKVLNKFNYFDCTPVSTPMDTNEKLMPNNGQAISQLKYTSNPGTQQWQAIQRVLKYLKKIMDYRLAYSGYPSMLEGYTNASWINNTEDNSSTSGWVLLLGGDAIS
nr:zinc finger, CCHC-type [Tanacetum cinerariifolium]